MDLPMFQTNRERNPKMTTGCHKIKMRMTSNLLYEQVVSNPKEIWNL